MRHLARLVEAKHYGTPIPAGLELLTLERVHGKHCGCLPCQHGLFTQHVGREGLAR